MAVAVLALCSCSKKLTELSSDYFTVTPQVLESVNGEVPVTIHGTFPAKFFPKKAVLTVTPVLKYNGGEAAGEAYTYQGEKVAGNGQAIPFKTGANVTLKSVFDYIPAMAKSELYLRPVVSMGSKRSALPDVKVADGVLATAELYAATAASTTPAASEDAFQRIIEQVKQANIMFLIQQANLRSTELSSKDLVEVFNTLKDVNADDRKELQGLEISAYASPDGALDLNDRLAQERQKNTRNYVNQQLKKAKVNTDVDAEYTAEDWEGFKQLVEASNIADKDLILRVLSMYKEPEAREREIKNISTVYADLANEILPQLRRARLSLRYQLIGRTDDEILAAFKSDPAVLSVEELLYAATLVKTDAEKNAIYKKATELFPSDYRAFNNLAQLAYAAADYDTAKSYLQRAARLNPSAPEVNTNLGMLELLAGNKAEAEAYLAKGTDAAANSAALGNLYIAQGQYARAAAAFADTKSNAAALAQMCASRGGDAGYAGAFHGRLDGRRHQSPLGSSDSLRCALVLPFPCAGEIHRSRPHAAARIAQDSRPSAGGAERGGNRQNHRFHRPFFEGRAAQQGHYRDALQLRAARVGVVQPAAERPLSEGGLHPCGGQGQQATAGAHFAVCH